MNNTSSPYLDLVDKILNGLAKIRMDSGAWIDNESEEQARETQVYKVGESIRPFYLAALRAPSEFKILSLPNNLLARDTEFFLKQVDKNHFFPSPYSPISGSVDQYTDFAAFVLEFCPLIAGFWKDESPRSKRIVDTSLTLAEQALEFLLMSDNRLSDDKGTRWAGTSKYRRVKKTEELYTDTYFTSVIVLALHEALENPVLKLPTSKRDDIREVIREAGKWIADRFDGQFITGDENNSNRKLLHTTWGLRALTKTYDILDKSIQRRLPPIANSYLDGLRNRKAFTYEQEYLTVLSKEVDSPLYYEDRSGLGGILLTLASLRDVVELEHILAATSYDLLVERVFNSVMALRNPTSGLWYSQQFILSIHSYLVEAFLDLDRHSKGVGGKIEVFGYMIRAAVKETLVDEVVINGLQQAVYERLLRIVESAGQSRKLQEGMGKLLASDDATSRDSTAKRRSRISKKSE